MLQKLKKMAFIVLIIIASIYLFVCGAVYFFQNKMVYHPTAEIVETPTDFGLPFEDVAFEAKDGTALHGWFVPGHADGPIVLFCHGNAGNISGRRAMLEIFSVLDASVFIFDYRGFGRSDGSPSEAGTYQDADAAWRYLVEKKGISANRIVLFGRSLGGGVASHLFAEKKPAGLILLSTFTTLRDVGQSAYPFLPIRLLSKFRYPNVENIRKHHAPILVMHGENDEMIPYSHGKELFRIAGEPKRFVTLNGGHNDAIALSRETITNALDVFFSSLGS